MKHEKNERNLPSKNKLNHLQINKVINDLFYKGRFFFVLLCFIFTARSFEQNCIPDYLNNRLLYLNT